MGYENEQQLVKRMGLGTGFGMRLDDSLDGIKELLRYEPIDEVIEFYGIEKHATWKDKGEGHAESVEWKDSPKFLKRMCLLTDIQPKHKAIIVTYFKQRGDIDSEQEFDEAYARMSDKRDIYSGKVQFDEHREEVEEDLKRASENPKAQAPSSELKELKEEFKQMQGKFDMILDLLKPKA